MISSSFFITLICQGQKVGHFSVSFKPGIQYYQGDLSESPLPAVKTTHFSAGIDIGYRPWPLIQFTLGYQYGKVSGADSLVPGHEIRNFHFYSNIHDVNVLTYINLNEIYRKIWPNKLMKKFDFKPGFTGIDLVLGFGIFKFNPKGEYMGEEYELQKLGTEGQHVNSGSYPEPYNLWQLNYKYGLSLGYNLSRQFSISLQGIYTVTFTDYIDDVSGTYPAYEKLIQSANGEATTYFTYGGRDGSKVREGNLRGNEATNDGYVNILFRLTYTFSKSEFNRIIKL